MNPIKTILTVTATAALILPAAALADAPAAAGSTSPAKQCKMLRSQLGADTFKLLGTNENKSNAFGKCVSAVKKAAKAERSATRAACRAASADPAAAKNAFGKCVSGQAKKDAREVRGDQRSAAKSCKEDRAADPAAFAAKNAFGKCVSKAAKAKAKARNDAALEAAQNDPAKNDTNPGQSKKQSS